MTTSLTMDDARDEELIRAGDHARLLARYRYRIRQRVRINVPERDVDDVVSDVFLYLYRELASGKRYDVPFGAVVARRTTWTIADYHRRNERNPVEPLHEDVSVEPEEVSDFGYVRRLLAGLPAGDAAVAKLHFVLGYTAGEIAEHLDMTANAVHQAVWRAKKRLRELLDE